MAYFGTINAYQIVSKLIIGWYGKENTMLMHDDTMKFGDDGQGTLSDDSLFKAALFQQTGDGYQCLEALGDDLSLEDTRLVDMDDLLLS